MGGAAHISIDNWLVSHTHFAKSLDNKEIRILQLPQVSGNAEQKDWKTSITKHAIECLECGETFKQLSNRHLSQHDLDRHSYRTKYGIPREQALSARESTARRRELVKRIRPWELAHAQRAGNKAPAKSGRRSAK